MTGWQYRALVGSATGPAAAHRVVNLMNDIPIGDLAYALRGVSYPAQRWQLLTWADYNAAPSRLRDAVWQLPERTYAHLYEVHDTIHARLPKPTGPPAVVPTADPGPPTVPGPTSWADRQRALRAVPSAARGGAPRSAGA